jgi:hypothetical protein
LVSDLKSALDQIKKKKSGLQIQPIRFGNEYHISVTYQNRKKDFQLIINKKDGGYIGIGKQWEF